MTTKHRHAAEALHEANLARWVDASKLVLTVNYSRVPEHIPVSFTRGRANGYVPYFTDRGLSRFFIDKGFEPN